MAPPCLILLSFKCRKKLVIQLISKEWLVTSSKGSYGHNGFSRSTETRATFYREPGGGTQAPYFTIAPLVDNWQKDDAWVTTILTQCLFNSLKRELVVGYSHFLIRYPILTYCEAP